jgi:hypothetical protein
VRVALGWKAHSGWAALVALGAGAGGIEVVDRRRVELVEVGDERWAGAPYHAAEDLEPDAARDLVRRGIESARRMAIRELRAAVKRAETAEREVVACAVLVGSGMPEWTVDEILAVHFRMHKAEGELFRDALARAAKACEVKLVAIPQKRLMEHAETALRAPAMTLLKRVATIGQSIGAPWGKDQKEAALAAMVALDARA